MSLSQPTPPDPGTTAAYQGMLNAAAMQQAAGTNQVNVNNPFGETNWSGAGGVNPSMTATFNEPSSTQFGLGQDITQYMHDTGDYSRVPQFTQMTEPLVRAQMAAMQPIFTQQESNLNSRLQNQGLPQGSQAWNNAERGQMASEDQALSANLPMFAQLAMQNYQMPLQTVGGLNSLATGGQPQTPIPTNAQANPANYAGLAEQNYQALQGQFNNTMQGISGLGSAAVTGLFGLRNPGGGSWLVG